MNDPRLSNRLYQAPQPTRPIAPSKPTTQTQKSAAKAGFQSILDAALAERPLHFSKHATERIEQRQIALSTQDVERLAKAVTSAANKGSRDSLILMNKTAFVINVPNRTVVTAVDEEHMLDKVFTNIDSAVVLN